MPANPSKNAPVKTRENECGSELSDVAGAVFDSFATHPALQHDQLMPECGILCFKPAPGFERDHRGPR
jgi:hypothetical protein